MAYASRSLSDTETRYSQTEREALAIVWACERFHLYVYGMVFKVVTDHKPLVPMFNNPRAQLPARIERWQLRLQPYTVTVKYSPGKHNPADFLSRHPLPSEQVTVRHKADEYVNYILDNAVPKSFSTSDIAKATQDDQALQKIQKAIHTGKWDKRLLRQTVWYPNIDTDSEVLINSCIPCQATGPAPKPEPLQMSELPSRPWSEISADFFGPVPTGEYVLVVIDEYSRFPEVDLLTSTSAPAVIPKMDRMFSIHGIPDQVKTDNGPPFQGKDFAKFSEVKGFHHRKITPCWPQANSEAERFMRTMGKAIRTAHADGKNWRRELNQFLLNYRATPHSTTGISPAELLFNRAIKTKLPEFHSARPTAGDETLRIRDSAAKDKMKSYADAKKGAQHSTIGEGDIVLVRQPKINKFSTTYSTETYRVLSKKGSMLDMVSSKGRRLARNTSHVKKVLVPKTFCTADSEHFRAQGSDCDDDMENPEHVVEPRPELEVPPRRNPARERRAPIRFRDQ